MSQAIFPGDAGQARYQVIERQGDECVYFLYERLSAETGLRHGVFTRKGGHSAPPFDGLNVAISTGDDPASARRNQAVVARVMGLPLISARIVHGNDIIVVERAAPQESLEEMRQRVRFMPADAMITAEPELGLFWGFADCAPILLYDPRHTVVALAHGGWRGAAGAIGPRTIQVMAERFGSRPEELLAGVGPAIQACCYQVNDTVVEAFAAEPLARENAVFEQRSDAEGQPSLYLDVTESNARQLLAAGVRPERLDVAPFCTGCEADLFYSHRMRRYADGRFGVVIGMAA
ncbi:MAG TPA: peptidoglycan editing factor PgeF [Ktedonobacterales bacterium]|nr:peptidoglycan editing factor PgeF [Ktedonobacterales bacterium]